MIYQLEALKGSLTGVKGDQTGACGSVWGDRDATIKAKEMQRRSQGCARDKIYRGLMNLKKNSWLGLAICKTLELVKRKIRKPMSSIVYV